MSFYCSHEYLTIICMNPISNAKLLNGQSVNVNAHHQHHRYSIGILCTRQRRSERDANEKCESLILNGFASIDCKSYINDMLRAGNKRLAEVVNVQQWQNDLPVCPFAGLHVLFCRCDRIIMIYKFGVVTVIVRSVRVPWHAKKKKKQSKKYQLVQYSLEKYTAFLHAAYSSREKFFLSLYPLCVCLLFDIEMNIRNIGQSFFATLTHTHILCIIHCKRKVCSRIMWATIQQQ